MDAEAEDESAEVGVVEATAGGRWQEWPFLGRPQRPQL